MADVQQSQQRLQNLGRLSELRDQEKRLRITCNGLVQNLMGLFEPMDRDLAYTYRINLMELDTYGGDLRGRVIELRRVRAEIEALQAVLGLTENE